MALIGYVHEMAETEALSEEHSSLRILYRQNCQTKFREVLYVTLEVLVKDLTWTSANLIIT